jgi:tetratricopeptide (TPR) repeat protein
MIALVAILGILAFRLSNSISLLAEFPGRDFNGIERIMTQFRVQLFHLTQLIWPVPGRLNLDHDFVVSRSLLNPATTLSALIACVGIIGSILFLAVRYPRYGFPLAGYLVFHSLEAGPINLEMVFEHRMYLPVAILAPLLTVFLVDTNRRYQITAIVLLAAFSLLLAGWTNARNQTWAEPLGIHRDMAVKSPNKSRTQYAYALALLEAEQAEDALPILRRAVVLDPDEGRVQRLLGETLLELGRPAEAEEAYRAAVTLTPSDLRSMLGLGQAMAANDKSEVAFRYYVSEGIRLGRAGRSFEAIPLLSAAIELRDDDAGARNALGAAFMGAELVDKALEQFRAAVRLDSTMFEAWFNLAHAAERLGQPQEAIRAYQAFIEHAPDSLQQPIMRARERIRALSSTDE